jgi:hypothetical protein
MHMLSKLAIDDELAMRGGAMMTAVSLHRDR